jgi:hypothetical protein
LAAGRERPHRGRDLAVRWDRHRDGLLPDADIELAAAAVAAGGYINAGQVCISVQRVITHPAVQGDFLDALVP